MTHYTTNGTAFLSTTTPFHSCATDLAFPVFRCASHPQMCNVDTVRSTEVGLIESRTSRASTGMQTPTGRLQSTWVNSEAARAWFLSWQTTGASTVHAGKMYISVRREPLCSLQMCAPPPYGRLPKPHRRHCEATEPSGCCGGDAGY